VQTFIFSQWAEQKSTYLTLACQQHVEDLCLLLLLPLKILQGNHLNVTFIDVSVSFHVVHVCSLLAYDYPPRQSTRSRTAGGF